MNLAVRSDVLDIFSNVFTAVFTVEMVIKVRLVCIIQFLLLKTE